MKEENEVTLCRLCVKSYDRYINIFDSNGTNGIIIWEVIKELIMLDVSEEDGLPPMICVGCSSKLVEFKEFKKMCITSRLKLMEMATRVDCVDTPSLSSNNADTRKDPVPISTQPCSDTSANLIPKQERSDSDTEEISNVIEVDCNDIGLRKEGPHARADISSPPSCAETQPTSRLNPLWFDDSLNDCKEGDIQSSDDDKDNITIDEPSCKCGEGYLCQSTGEKRINWSIELLPCLLESSGVNGQQKEQRKGLKRKLPSTNPKIGCVEGADRDAQVKSRLSREVHKVGRSSLVSEAELRTNSEKNGQVDDLDRVFEKNYYCRYCKCIITFRNVAEIVEHMSLMHENEGEDGEGDAGDEMQSKKSEVNTKIKNYVCSDCKTSFHSGKSLARHLMWAKRRGHCHVGNIKEESTRSNSDACSRDKEKSGNNAGNITGECASVSNRSFEEQSRSSLESDEPFSESGLMYGNVTLKECRVVLRDVMNEMRKDCSVNVNKESLRGSCSADSLGGKKIRVDEEGVSVKSLRQSKIMEYASHDSNTSPTISTGNESKRNSTSRVECEGLSETQEFRCDHCKGTFTEKTILESHILLVHLQKTRNYVSNKDLKTEKSVLVWRSKYFFCDVCVSSFSSKAALKHHLMRNHMEKLQYTCHKCSVPFRSSSSFWKHLANHPQRNGHYICSNCLVIFSSKATLVSHIIDDHGGAHAAICEDCRKGYCSEENLSRHKCSSILNYFLCRNCGKSNTNDRKREHELRCHLDVKEYMCRICCDMLGNKYYFKRHLETHSSTKKYACNECPAKYKWLKSLNEHIKAIHGKGKDIVCNLCGKKFLRAVYLRRHRLVHLDERPFQCDVCPARFKVKPHLITHKAQVHLKQMSFKCDECEKTFSAHQSWKRHKISHHLKVKPFQCDECPSAFSRKFQLEQHVNSVHRKVRKYSCKSCPKKFQYRISLGKHMNCFHCVESPFVCSFCGRRFKDSKALVEHKEKFHIKPFRCDLCPKGFNSKQKLEQHKNGVHERTTEYVCNICELKFFYRQNLVTHMKRKHSDA